MNIKQSAKQKVIDDRTGRGSWAEVRDPHPEDTMLRDKGFVLRRRDKGCQPMWQQGNHGPLYTQNDALEMIGVLLVKKS